MRCSAPYGLEKTRKGKGGEFGGHRMVFDRGSWVGTIAVAGMGRGCWRVWSPIPCFNQGAYVAAVGGGGGHVFAFDLKPLTTPTMPTKFRTP